MKTIITFLAATLLATSAWAGDTVAVPWQEIKQLYRESIERGIKDRSIPDKPVHSIDEAQYDIQISPLHARGSVTVKGRQLLGKPIPIPLLGSEIALTDVRSSLGGALLSGQDHDTGIAFLPDGMGPFEIQVDFICPLKPEGRFQKLKMQIPVALKNTLTLDADGIRHLVPSDDMTRVKKVFHFNARHELDLGFIADADKVPGAAPELELFSIVQVLEKQVVIRTTCLPAAPPSSAVTVVVPQGFSFSRASRHGDAIKPLDKNHIRISPNFWDRKPFDLVFIRPRTLETRKFELSLPKVRNNQSRDHYFHLSATEDGEIIFPEDLQPKRLPAKTLGAALASAAGRLDPVLKAPVDHQLRFEIARWQQVPVPAVVLDTVTFYTAFEENGHILSVLSLQAPPSTGDKIRIKPLADARVWSLKVNGRSRGVYTDDAGDWIIPLPEGRAADVELAFLRKGKKLGLAGRLETILPRTGLQSRQVRVGIALPGRIKLVSLEGDISPDPVAPKVIPAEFVGDPYYFSRSFFSGDALHLALSYKEPAKGKP